jgi:[acyl-carrier-protein] S-malonyltransferase/trans-AT polyketide synthase/acyltransferase/oxidoreductase domain-containing protein
MGKTFIAAVFPGQGTQRVGMGKDFYDNIPASREVFEEASDALGWDMAKMCFEGDDRIDLTEYAQPCILATEIAMLRGLRERYGFAPDFFGGHSLGEYSALTAAGALPFTDALKIVHNRGKLMQVASPEGVGGMAAVIADTIDVEKIKESIADFPMDVANINSVDQVVISGQKAFMEVAEKNILGLFEKDESARFVPLNVSAPFHSRFMSDIKDAFKDILYDVKNRIRPEKAATVTSNFSGKFHEEDCDKVIDNLVSQLSGTVQWRDNMKILSDKVTGIYEIGPNKPLRKFFSTIGVKCKSIVTLSNAKNEFESA